MNVEPYLFFDGRCDEALDFYRRALGAEVGRILRNKDNPEPPPGGVTRGTENKVLHCIFRIGDTAIMASDGESSGRPDFRGFGLALNVASPAEADRTFDALADGGKVTLPLSATFFSPRFGMVTDRFGVQWMVMAAK